MANWQPRADPSYDRQHATAIIERLRNGNTDSMLAWAYKILSMQGSCPEQPAQTKKSRQQTSKEQRQQPRKEKDGSNPTTTSTSRSSQQQKEQPLHRAANIKARKQAVICAANFAFIPTPVGARSIAYLTKLPKPTFNSSIFEKRFASWEFEGHRYERDNQTQFPDKAKIAIPMNETPGPFQQSKFQDARGNVMKHRRSTASTSNRNN